MNSKALLSVPIFLSLSLSSLGAQVPGGPPLESMPPWTSGEFLRGDANGDGTVNLADPIFLLNLLFKEGPLPTCTSAADANDDEQIDVSDVVRMLLAIFSRGEVLPEPWPLPGQDPTEGTDCTNPGGSNGEVDEDPPPPVDTTPETDSYYRIGIRLSPTGLEVLSAVTLPGTLASTSVIHGDFIWEICDSVDQCLAVGSFEDPRGERGGRVADVENGEHSFGTNEAGIATVDLLASDVTTANVFELRLRIYRLTDAGAEVTRVTPETMAGLRRKALALEFETGRTSVLGDALAPILGQPAVVPETQVLVPDHFEATMTPLMLNGHSSQKIDLVVIGDGFNAAEQEEYNDIVDEMVMDGTFRNSAFGQSADAFNVYRINAKSIDSGVTSGTPTQYRSQTVDDRDDEVFSEGDLVISFNHPNIPGFAVIQIDGPTRSLSKLEEAIEQVSFQGTDACGNAANFVLNTRVIADSDRDFLWIGSPKNLPPGPLSDFTLQFNIAKDAEPGSIPLSFSKTTGSITPRQTALDYIYFANWDYCWVRPSCRSAELHAELLKLVPVADYTLIIQNRLGSGACGYSKILVVKKDSSWMTVQHELGHTIGNLADEYTRSRPYTDPERPPKVNADNRVARNEIKWRDFIAPLTPLPTLSHHVFDHQQDVGAFEGSWTYGSGIYRPVFNCRMRTTAEEFCPVCYSHLREMFYPYQRASFYRSYTGDFNGDGKADVVKHTDTQLSLFYGTGSRLEPGPFQTLKLLAKGWLIRPGDRYFVGDHNGDGMDDLYAFNATDWGNNYYLGILQSTEFGFAPVARYDGKVTGYVFKTNDRFLVADLDGDNKDDLIVYNLNDWITEYMGLLRSNGFGVELRQRYDDVIPGNIAFWDMATFDNFLVADFNGDGKDDLYAQNTRDWPQKFVGMLRSTGTTLDPIRLYVDTMVSWSMVTTDRLLAADFNGDDRADLVAFNGGNGPTQHLALLQSTGTQLALTRFYADVVPGWDMQNADVFLAADVDGDGKDDLYASNTVNWADDYLGVLHSNGTELSGSFQTNQIGRWSLDSADRFLVGDHDGDGSEDLFIRKDEWMALLTFDDDDLLFTRLYYHWIHNFRYSAILGHSDGTGI